MVRRKVNYKVIYQGEETIDLEPGTTYECVAEVYDGAKLHDLAVIDGSGEDYLYEPDVFKRLTK